MPVSSPRKTRARETLRQINLRPAEIMEHDRLNHKIFMEAALEEAAKAGLEDEVPIGAVAVGDGEIIAREHNRTIQLNDPTAHAEILLLKKAASHAGNYRLPDITVYVTVEPCPMCAGALIQARIKKLVFGTADIKGGGVVSRFNILEPGKMNHDIEFESGVLEDQCREIIQSFFTSRR